MILNVDDHAPARLLRSRILERGGFQVQEAASGDEAISSVRATLPDLVLLDVGLPDRDGYSVCEEMKTLHANLPIVMITTVFRNSRDRAEGFRAGADEYLLEPVEPDLLLETVKRMLHPDRHTQPRVATIITDQHGDVQAANATAAELLNLTPRGLANRSLLAFFAPGRARIHSQMRVARTGVLVQERAVVRPRDKKPIHIDLDISAASLEQGGGLVWTLRPRPDEST